MKEFIQKYIEQFTPEQKKVYEIATRILGSSYQIEKSIGFLEFIKESESKKASENQ
jgi:hypothetical protein